MNLGTKRETFAPNENQEWLGSAHGTQECDPVTLYGPAFLATFEDGVVPSGVVIARYDAGAQEGLYGPYADAGADGLDVAAGHLFTTKDLGGTTAETAANVSGALYWHGEVVVDKLPTGHGLTAAARADLNQIRYQD